MTRYVGIDPSTKTGIVVLDEDGEVWDAMEIEKDGKDPGRMVNLIEAITERIHPDDYICIENFAFAQANKMAMLGGIGWGIRCELWKQSIRYTEVSTGQLKNFVGCPGNCSKETLILPLHKIFEFEHKSDNVRDAYILAQISRALHEPVKLLAYQKKVIQTIQDPPAKKSKKKGKSA